MSGVSREMVYLRTTELAAAAGRPPHGISQKDYERAKLELTGESDPRQQEAILAAADQMRK